MWRISPPDNLSCEQISPHDRFFSTGTARGARDKYEVWLDGDPVYISNTETVTLSMVDLS